MDLSIIQAVKSHPILYDMKNTHYFKYKKRQITWDIIAKDLNLKSGDEAKSKWNRIKRSYCRYLHNKCNFKKTNFKYSEDMKFLKDKIGKDVKKVTRSVPEDDEELSDFFIEAYQDTKKLSVEVQEHVKKGIYTIIQEAKKLERNSSPPPQQHAEQTVVNDESPPPALVEYINNFTC